MHNIQEFDVSIVESPFPLASLNFRPITPITNASQCVVRGRVYIPRQTRTVEAFVKVVGVRALAVESVCAWLAREVGLPMPQPYLVTVQRSRVPDRWPFGDAESSVCFGTEALTLARPVDLATLNAGLLPQLIKDPTLLSRIAVFDELIGNDDRHNGNLLLTPRRELYLIDHERALGGTGLGLFSTFPPPGPNYLLGVLKTLPAQARQSLKPTLRGFCADCRNAVYRLPYEQLVPEDGLRQQIIHYLTRRADHLFEVVSEAIGMPDLTGLRLPADRPCAP